MEGQSEHTFRRELRTLDATMLVMGSMIGSGIFIVSADIARTVGSPGYLLLVWLVTGAVTIAAALSYGELAGMMPHAGGQYVYLREAYSPMLGFLYGWTLFLVIQTGTIAAVAVAFAKFTAVLFPSLGENTIVFPPLGRKISAAQLVAIASIIVLTAVNLRGIHGGKLMQNLFTAVKVIALGGVILLGITVGLHLHVFAANFRDMWNTTSSRFADGTLIIEPIGGMALLTAFGAAMVGSLFSSDAWNNITFTAAEVVDPHRTIPRSLVLGTAAVTVIYILANIAYLGLLPLRGDPLEFDVASRGIQYALSDRVATAAASVIFGEPAVLAMAILIMISTFGCNNGLILSGARVSYAMAKDGLFFTRCGKLNKYGVPGVALVLQAVWASLLCLSGTYSNLLDYVVFAVLIFYILTVAGVFVLRRKKPHVERPYRTLGYPVLPALYILVAAAIALDILIAKPAFTWPGVVIVLLGIPVFVLRRSVMQRAGT